jgi:tetratricopeptide (TPR) repeat protein
MFIYTGTSQFDIGKGFGEYEYDFFTIDGENDFSSLIDYYRTQLKRFNYFLDGYSMLEDNKELSPAVKQAMKSHNANISLTFYASDMGIKHLTVNRKVSKDVYSIHIFDFFHFVVDKAPVYFNKGRVYQRNNYHTAAIAYYTHAIILNPNSVDTYINRGYSYKEKGDIDSARNDFVKAMELDPDDANIQEMIDALGD